MALLQSVVADDGRTAVLRGMLGVLAEVLDDQWTIEVWTAGTDAATDLVAGADDERVVLRPLPARLAAAPASVHIPLASRLFESRVGQPDLLVSGNSTRFARRIASRELHYVHHPPEGHAVDPHLGRLPRAAWSLMAKLTRGDLPDDAVVVANSSYTRGVLAAAWHLSESRIDVVPPPHPGLSAGQVADGPTLVVSLGAFVPSKRTHEQIEVARRLPYLEFILAGRSSRRPYAVRLRATAARVPNVTLAPDLSDDARDDLLRRGTVMLHTRRGEHFGIAVMEAVEAGCVPVVHDSGGVRDLVAPVAERCMFRDLDQAVERVRDLASLDRGSRQELLRRLVAGTAESGLPSFDDGFRRALDRAMEGRDG